jgi:hypothetical protein
MLFSDGLPQAVDPFPYIVLAILVAAAVVRWIGDRRSRRL